MGSHSLVVRGFTLTELLCVIGIIGLLAAILAPAVVTSRRRAQSSACVSNLRQWGGALLIYTQDYDGNYPAALTASFKGDKSYGGTGWYTALEAYTKTPVFICPSRWVSESQKNNIYSCGYALNTELNEIERGTDTSTYSGKNEALLQAQSNIVSVFDARPGIIASDVADTPNSDEVIGIYVPAMQTEIMSQPPGALRHNGGANYGFADGHTKWLRPDALIRICDGTKPCFKP